MPSFETIDAQVRRCQSCPLHEKRIHAVPGEGNSHAELLFIGEGPGKNEDQQGRPFVGAAGKLLEELLTSIDRKREDVFITNVVKCRPPGNRDPEPLEIETCTRLYLDRQIELIQPRLIVLLGRHASEHFLPGRRISEIHGKPKRVIKPDLSIRVYYPVFHPAAALYRNELHDTLVRDFTRIPRVLAHLDPAALREIS